MGKKIRIGALISGGGTNLQAIIDACESGKIDGETVFVGSDKPNARGIERAKARNIPTFVVDYGAISREYRENPEDAKIPDDFDLADLLSKQNLIGADTEPGKTERFLKTRAIAEAALIRAMQPYPFDLLVLAGFMRTLSPYFIDRVNTVPGDPRIMNIHPALLPVFPGVDGYGDTYRYGCKIGGCTVHFVDYGEDTGPIIGQCAFQIGDGDTLDDIKKKGLRLEWDLYTECVQKFAQGRLGTVKMTHKLKNGGIVQRTVVKCADIA